MSRRPAGAALITAMLSWDGPGRQYQRSCVSYLEDVFGGAIETLYSNPTNIEEMVMRADLLIERGKS